MCVHPGTRTSGVLVYLPRRDVFERTDASFQEAADESGGVVDEVFGRSVLASTLDLVESIPVDYMHCAREGVAKWLLKAWTSSSNYGKAYYVHGQETEVCRLSLCLSTFPI